MFVGKMGKCLFYCEKDHLNGGWFSRYSCTVSLANKTCSRIQGQNISFGECDFNQSIDFTEKFCSVTFKGIQEEGLLSVKILQANKAVTVKTPLKKIVPVTEEEIKVSFSQEDVKEGDALDITCEVTGSAQPKPSIKMMLMKEDDPLDGSEALFSKVPTASTEDGETEKWTFTFNPKHDEHQGLFPYCKVVQDQVGNFSNVSVIFLFNDIICCK